MANDDTNKEDEIDRRLARLEMQRDQDSFNSLTTGLTDNWVILVAIVTGVFWVFQSVTGLEDRNMRQDNRMDRIVTRQEENAEAIGNNASAIDQLDDGQSGLQRDISEINASLEEIKSILNE